MTTVPSLSVAVCVIILQTALRIPDVVSLSQATTYPSRTCYSCNLWENPYCDGEVANIKGFKVTNHTYLPNSAWAFQYDGLVIPQRPYCISYVTQVKWRYSAVTKTWFGRTSGYPGELPNQAGLSLKERCVDEFEMSDRGVKINDPAYVMTRKNIYCNDSDYCNTVTLDEIIRACFDDQMGTPIALTTWSPLGFWQNLFKLKADNQTGLNVTTGGSTRVTRAQNPILTALTVVTALSTRSLKGSQQKAWITVLMAVLFIVGRNDALRCYFCRDDPSKVNSVNRECYDALQLLPADAQVDCPDRLPPKNTIGLTYQQKGYCYAYIEQYTGLAFGGNTQFTKNSLARGCMYPGGEPDDCLVVEGHVRPMIERVYTVQYCRSDMCNNELFAPFVDRCFNRKGTSTITTRDFNITFTAQTITSPPTLEPTLPAKLVEEINIGRALLLNGTSTTAKTGGNGGTDFPDSHGGGDGKKSDGAAAVVSTTFPFLHVCVVIAAVVFAD